MYRSAIVNSQQPRISRRRLLTVGGTGLLGISLADVLRGESLAGVQSSGKSVINIHLDGGPPQHDTIDPKPDAPAEIRGEFQPIATKIPGFRISELMPQVAARADRMSFIRSLVGSAGAHDAFQCQSGFPAADLRPVGGRPAVGCVLSHLWGTPQDPAPAFVDLMQGRPMVRDSARPGFLGQASSPFRPDISHLFHRELEPAMKGELARRGPSESLRLTLTEGLTFERIDARMQLLASFDGFRRDLDSSGVMDAMDKFGQQAITILTSGKLAAALDIEQEPQSVIKLYTPTVSSTGVQSYTSEDGHAAKKLMLARRLIEAGARCVSVSFSDFDTHSNNFPRMRNLMPIVDHALCALHTDLENRNLLDQVVVLVWGEFGRSPRVNKDGGRDHWPEVGPALMFGGGIRSGQVVGATDRLGAKVIARPVSYQDIFATVYHCLGIDPISTTLLDPTGRPQHLLDRAAVIRELV